MSFKGGLSFLNKKSWHTKKVSNVEKVWLAEQKDASEKEKIEQLRQELEEERAKEAERELQYQSGLLLRPQRVEWMYQAPSIGPSNEDYLTGASTIKIDNSDAINPIGATFTETKVNERLEIDNKLREDPLMHIRKMEKEKTEAVVQNPRAMQLVKKSIFFKKDPNHSHSSRHHHSHKRNGRTPLSKEEIARKIAEYKNNANDEHHKRSIIIKKEKEEQSKESLVNRETAQFLASASGFLDDSTLADNIKRNRYKIERK